jgi:Acetyltransferase (isoleucine patch superfamily)
MLRVLKSKLLSWIVSNIDRYTRIEVSTDSKIETGAKIKGAVLIGQVNVGEYARIFKGVRIVAKSGVSIGRYTSINGPNTDINCMLNPVRIGSFCSIARNVSIQEFNHNYRLVSTYHVAQNIFGGEREEDVVSKGEVLIGNDVWIGTQCVITGGATIGDGAVIAANSVVNGEIPPYAIAAGSPAKVIGYRFDENVVALLRKIRWWEWPLEKIQKNRSFFREAPTITLLEKILDEETRKDG